MVATRVSKYKSKIGSNFNKVLFLKIGRRALINNQHIIFTIIQVGKCIKCSFPINPNPETTTTTERSPVNV